jgi:hypothetical protein
VCQLSTGVGLPRFALAPGVTCLLLTPEAWPDWALLELPSGALRFAPAGAYVFLGGPAPGERAAARGANAGLARRYGRCPQVRGTAMNPNDHPHGGRTRAQRWQRTPWGRTAKCSRRPSGIPRFKALARRPVRRSRAYVVVRDGGVVSADAEAAPEPSSEGAPEGAAAT